MPRQPFTLIYDREVLGHLRAIERKHRRGIRAAIEKRLSHEPVIESRNRMPLSRPSALERFILAHTPRFRRLLDAAERRIRKGRGLGHGAFWKAASRR